jgi:hypothetical protein
MYQNRLRNFFTPPPKSYIRKDKFEFAKCNLEERALLTDFQWDIYESAVQGPSDQDHANTITDFNPSRCWADHLDL